VFRFELIASYSRAQPLVEDGESTIGCVAPLKPCRCLLNCIWFRMPICDEKSRPHYVAPGDFGRPSYFLKW